MSQPTAANTTAPDSQRATMPARDPTTGQFLPGNRARRVHGAYSFAARGELPPELQAWRAALDEFAAAVESDQGGADGMPALRAGLVRRAVKLEGVCELLGADIAARGLFTPTGRIRATFSALMRAVDSYSRLAALLGLDRRARSVQSIDEYLSRYQQQAAPANGDEPSSADAETVIDPRAPDEQSRAPGAAESQETSTFPGEADGAASPDAANDPVNDPVACGNRPAGRREPPCS